MTFSGKKIAHATIADRAQPSVELMKPLLGTEEVYKPHLWLYEYCLHTIIIIELGADCQIV